MPVKKTKLAASREDREYGSSNLALFTIHASDRKPSWLRFGGYDGWANLSVRMHKQAGWLDVTLNEGYTSDKGKAVEKITMLSVEPEQAKALYEFLKFHFENKAADDALDNEPINVEDELEVFP